MSRPNDNAAALILGAGVRRAQVDIVACEPADPTEWVPTGGAAWVLGNVAGVGPVIAKVHRAQRTYRAQRPPADATAVEAALARLEAAVKALTVALEPHRAPVRCECGKSIEDCGAEGCETRIVPVAGRG